MASFPALPSGNNPYIGAAQGYGSAAASVFNSLQAALNQKANQQAIAKRESDAAQVKENQQALADQLEMARMGGVPAQTYGGDVPPDPTRPTLRRPETNPAAQGAGMRITDGYGNQTYIPTASEKEQATLNDTNSFVAPPGSDLETWMQQEAGIKPGTRISFSHVPALLQLHKSLQPDEPPSETFRVDDSNYVNSATGKPVAMLQGDRGTIIPPAGSPYRGIGPGGIGQAPGPVSFAGKSRADSQQVLEGVEGPSGGKLVFDRDKGVISEVPLPAGSKQTMTPAQQEADKDRHVRESEVQENRATRQTEAEQRRADAQARVDEQYARAHEAAGLKKDNMQAMAQGYWDAKATQPGGTYFPPRLVNGTVVPGPATVMPPKGPEYEARLKDLETTARGFEKTAATHQAEQERIEKARGWGKYAKQQQTAAQAPAQPQAAPAAKSPAPRPKVLMKAPDGTVQPVDADQVEHYKSRGAVVVTGS